MSPNSITFTKFHVLVYCDYLDPWIEPDEELKNNLKNEFHTIPVVEMDQTMS